MADQLVLFRICTVDGCSRQSYVPGSGKGMCGLHYKRWSKYGDPLADRRRVRNVCSVDGCAKWCETQGICGTHAWRLRNHGTVTPRLQGQVVDGKRICPGCGEDKPLAAYGKHSAKPDGRRSDCRECCKLRTREWRKAHPEYQQPPSPPEKAQAWSRAWRRNNPDYRRRQGGDRRARVRAALTGVKFTRQEIFDRDGWVCQICEAPIDSALVYPDPFSASLDHKVPLARGGKHHPDNCQAAHLRCNLRKHLKVAA